MASIRTTSRRRQRKQTRRRRLAAARADRSLSANGISNALRESITAKMIETMFAPSPLMQTLKKR